MVGFAAPVKLVLSSTVSKTDLGPIQFSIEWVPDNFLLEQGDRIVELAVKVISARSCTSTPQYVTHCHSFP
jgi:hypothetical protein